MDKITLGDINVYVAELPTNLPKREAEKQAKRQVLDAVLGETAELTYDANGKPHLPQGYVSISHSKTHLAMAFAPHEIGVDIETISPRIERLQTRFLTEEEQAMCGNSLAVITRCWCAKEAIYKIVGAPAGAIGERIAFRLSPSGVSHFPNIAECDGRLFKIETLRETEEYVLVVAKERH